MTSKSNFDILLNNKYNQLEKETLQLFSKGQVGDFFKPKKRIKLVSNRDSKPENLYDNLDADSRDIYDMVSSALKHKTPNEDRIQSDTQITEAIVDLRHEINSSIDGDEYRPIFFRGGKGCGKTTSLNYLIYEFNNNFNSRNSLIIRGCAEEYVRIKSDRTPLVSDNWGIRDYFSCQLVSVLVQNRGLEPFRSLIENFGDRECQIYRKKQEIRTGTIRQQIRLLTECLAELVDDGYPHPGQIRTCELMRFLSNNDRDFSFINWDFLFSAINDYLVENSIQIFNVFDGLDNVWSFDEEEIEIFKQTITELVDELAVYSMSGTRGKRITKFYIVACRPETHSQILHKLKSPKEGGLPCKTRSVSFDAQNIEYIVRRKFIAARGDLKEIARSRRTSGMTLSKQARNLVEVINSQQYQNIATNLANEHGTTVEELFSNNIRGYLQNFLGFSLYLAYLSDSRKSSRRLAGIVTQYHVFTRNLFFGGRRYLNTSISTNSAQVKHEIIFPNLFHFHVKRIDDSEMSEKEYRDFWSKLKNPTLLGINILKFMQSLSEPVSRTTITEEICSSLGYDEKVTMEFLRRMLQFRLIEAIEPDEDDEDIGFILYKVLPAAKILLELLRTSPDILTYLGLDAILPAQHSRRIFRETNLDLNNEEHVQMVLNVTLKFLAYINALSKHEGGATVFPVDNYLDRANALLSSYQGDVEELINNIALFKNKATI